MMSRLAAVGLVSAALVTLAGPARAYYLETHTTGDDVRLHVDTAGVARIEHLLAVRVVAGQLHTIDVVGVEPTAVPESAVTVTAEDGREMAGDLASRDPHALRVTIAEPKGLRRGRYRVHLAYSVDLVQAHELVRDGVMWRVAWPAPVAPEGYDSARVTMELPGSPTEPQAIASDGVEGNLLSTLRRDAEHDAIELVRPHVARGESVIWAVRVAPKAFAGVRDATLRPPPPAPVPEPNHLRGLGVAFALLLAAFAYGAIAWSKTASFARACARFAGTVDAPRGLVPLPASLRASLAGAAFAVGIATQALGAPTLGALAIAIAMAMAALRVPDARTAARGPGRWLAMRPAEAFEPAASRSDAFNFFGAFDIGTRAGKIVLAVSCALVALGAYVAGRFDPEAPYLLVLDALALVPIFATGCASQLPPDRARAPARVLRGLFARLAKRKAVHVVPWGRVPVGAEAHDELRLCVSPRAPIPGFAGIEVGVAWWRTLAGYAGATEVLVRVRDASAASARMTTLARFAKPMTGRGPEERVYRLAPRLPTRAMTLALVERLARELADRRVSGDAWTQAERRVAQATREETRAAA